MRQFGRHRKPCSDAERTKRSGIHPLAWAARPHCLRGNRHDVAAVADVDCILFEKLVDFPSEPVRVNRLLVRLEERHQLFQPDGFNPAQFPHPLPARLLCGVNDSAGGGLGNGGQDCAGMAGKPERDVAVLADGAVAKVDLNQGRSGNPLSVTHAKVEWSAHDQNDVGLLECIRSGAVEAVLVAWRHHSAGGAVRVDRDVQSASEFDALFDGAGRPNLLSEQRRRPFGSDEHIGEPLDVVGVAKIARGRLITPGRGYPRPFDRNFGVKYVSGNFEIARPEGAGEALARGHRNHVGNAFRRKHAGGKFGDRRHQVNMRQILQRSHPVLGQRRLAADVQHGAFASEGRRDARHRVRASGTGRGDHAAELAGLAGIAVRRVGGDLFVPYIHDADVLVDAAVVNVDDVSAAERENGVDAFVPERFGDQAPAGNNVLVLAFPGKRVMGCCGGCAHAELSSVPESTKFFHSDSR